MAKPEINNYEDLMAEKERLKLNARRSRQQITESFEALKDELNPFASLKHTAQQALSGDKTNPIVKFGINRATEFLLGKLILKRAGWLPRLVIPFAVKQIASRIISDKPDKKMADMLHRLAGKIRGDKKSFRH